MDKARLTYRRGILPERRCLGDRPTLEARAVAGVAEGEHSGRVIRGHAAVFDTWTTLYESPTYKWIEKIRRGAFTNAIAEKQDVYALFNHCADWILGRSTAGTCRLAEDNVGLAFEADPDEGSTVINSIVLRPMDRKELDRCSFAFAVRPGGEVITIRQIGDQLVEERELIDLDLYDVSVVTYPQYKEAECELCSRAEARGRELRAGRAGDRRGVDVDAARRSMALRAFVSF